MVFEFSTISVLFIFVFVGILTWYCAGVIRKRKKLQPIQFITYGKHKFNRDFEFTCEYCNKKISTKVSNCPACSASYGENKEYKNKRRESNLAYLQFLKNQEQLIKDETQYVDEMSRLQTKNSFFVRPTYFNFDLQPIPPFRKSQFFEFPCEYCDTKLKGRSDDEKTCSNCGAGYSDNVELLVAEQEESLEKEHYVEYITLQDIQWNRNIDNYSKDKEYNKFWVDGIGKWLVALTILLVVIIIPIIICVVISINS